MPETSARVRRVYLNIGEVIDPTTSPIDITRSNDWTLYTVHPGILTGAPLSAHEIAEQLAPWLDDHTLTELTNDLHALSGTPPPRLPQEP